MLARESKHVTDDGERSIDYVKADVVRGPKRKTRLQLTPTEEMDLRDKVWVVLRNQGLTPHEIEKACARANQSERNIRRRLDQFAKDQQVRLRAEAG